jgi:hypothetical protein
MFAYSKFNQDLSLWNPKSLEDFNDIFFNSGWGKVLGQENPSLEEVIAFCKAQRLRQHFQGIGSPKPLGLLSSGFSKIRKTL